jgi:hypothetical protein
MFVAHFGLGSEDGEMRAVVGLNGRLSYFVAACAMIAAQVAVSQAQPAGPATESTIAFRLTEPKTVHFDDAQKLSAHLGQVQKLGCEVTQGEHAGHGDVTYRCPKWSALTVASDELAHQWEEWLEGAGFETLHGHSEEHAGDHDHAHEHGHEHGDEAEEVTYMLADWVTLKPNNPSEAGELVAIAKALGCEVKEARGPVAIEVSLRCVDQKHIDCSSHEAAEFWQQWLSKTGFKADHAD